MACNRERVLVEDKEAFENLQVLFVQHCAADAIVQLLIRKWAFSLKALVGQGRPGVKQVSWPNQWKGSDAYISRCASSIGYCTIAKLT